MSAGRPLREGVVMLSPAPMPFSPFSSSARSLKFRGTCATAMIADVGGSGSFRSVMARFCRGKAGVAVSSMGKRTKLSVFVVAQLVGAGVGGGLMACSAGHKPAIRSNAKPWTHGMVGSWLAEQPSPGLIPGARAAARAGSWLSHPPSLRLTGQRRPSSKLQQFRPATCKGPSELSFHFQATTPKSLHIINVTPQQAHTELQW